METLYLAHHGVKGQKWGVRRYQNADGTYTAAGARRYSSKANELESYRKESNKEWDGLIKNGGLKTKKGTTLFTADEAKQMKAEENKNLQQRINTAKATADYKQNRANYVQAQSKGKRVAKLLLVGPVGAHTYNTVRASGGSRQSAAAQALVAGLTSMPIGYFAKHDYIDKQTSTYGN